MIKHVILNIFKKDLIICPTKFFKNKINSYCEPKNSCKLISQLKKGSRKDGITFFSQGNILANVPEYH